VPALCLQNREELIDIDGVHLQEAVRDGMGLQRLGPVWVLPMNANRIDFLQEGNCAFFLPRSNKMNNVSVD